MKRISVLLVVLLAVVVGIAPVTFADSGSKVADRDSVENDIQSTLIQLKMKL